MPVPPLVTVHPLGICKLKSAVSYSSSSTDLAAVGVTAISSFDEDTEIQIRTLAMNFWATIEHTLRYKYDGDYPPEIQHRLERAAEAAFLLDEEMSEIKEEIQEAQNYYSKKRAKNHNND